MTKKNAHKILAVDDHPDALYALERMLRHNGFEVITAGEGSAAISAARQHQPSVMLLDVMMPEMNGLEVTRAVKADPLLRFIPIILVTAKDTLEDVVAGLDIGADGYIVKPFKPEELLARTRAALRIHDLYEELRSTKERNSNLLRQLASPYAFDHIIGESPAMQEVMDLVRKVADTDTPILIAGPSGTGKEMVARALHYNSSRRDEPFVAQNCAAFSEHLLESQLFGHVRGSFTGAIRDQKGLFEAADQGTLFLDEIGEMMPSLQAKLLRVLQEGTFMPVGSTEEKRVDVRVVAASNRDLNKMCEEGTFREDLYYRLSVIRIEMPPLAGRRGDVPLLVEEFLRRSAAKRNSRKRAVSAEAMKKLEDYHWKGNVRELENEIERMLILGGDRDELDAALLSPHIRTAADKPDVRDSGAAQSGAMAGSLKEEVEELERRMIAAALEKSGGNKSTAAKELGISRSNLIAKVKQYGLE